VSVARLGGIAALAALVLLAGCASSSSRPKPTALEPLAAKIAGRQVWNQRLGRIDFPLAIAARDGVFTVAASDGTVLALQADTGRELWRGNAGGNLSAGVGTDGTRAAVVTREGDLVVLEAGAVKWRKRLAGLVTTAPLVAGERVFVLAVDRTVEAYDAIDGRRLWRLQRPGDPLTLSQAGVLSAFKDTLVAGQGARMTGIDPLRGTVRWEVAVASPRGTNEVERLADLVAPAVRVGDLLCARAFQSSVGCVNAERGTLAWSRTAGGTQGVAADAQWVFGADGSDRLSAWRAEGGEPAWTSEGLLYRDLSTPVSIGATLVFGDGEGLVHWLSRDKGEPLLRLPTDGTAIVAAPAVAGTTMLVATRGGGLFAFRPE
jgi:outer membrane protein assembly factor BamB